MRVTAGARAASLAFVTAFLTLFVQILVHRVLSAKLFHNYAFLVISLTMLGFAISAVVLGRWRGPLVSRLEATIATSAALFVLTLLAVCVAFYRADMPLYLARSRGEFVTDFLRLAPLALLYAVPFGCCGLILGALLAAPGLPTSRIYGWDLAGSALGAFAVIPAIGGLGVEASLLLAGAVMLLGAFVLAPACGAGPRVLLSLAAGALLVTSIARDAMFEMRYPRGSPLANVQALGAPYGVEYEVWDPVARIEISRIRPPSPRTFGFPALIGEDEAFLVRFRRMLTMNNFAFTFAVDYDGRPESLAGIGHTIYAAAYQASSVTRPHVLVIGVGGGFDVLTALHFAPSRVTGVEVNEATLDLLTRTYREYFRHWVDDPRVRLVQAEGRHFLSSSPERFDVIQLSGVDSYSGNPGAAHVFSESYLYTAEAFDLYLSRLSDDGVLNMMRLEHIPKREMLRALITAVGALRRAGVARPIDHIMMLTTTRQDFTALLVKRSPFTPSERRRVAAWADRSRLFSVSAGAGMEDRRPDPYQAFLSLGDARLEAAYVARYPFDIEPAVNDRPFFFRHSFWWHLFPRERVTRHAVPMMEYSVLMLLTIVGLVAFVCVYLPVRRRADADVPSRLLWRYGTFFAAIATGYLAIEIAFLQKLGLFLGHPNYALSVVLAAMLVATGIGSLLSGALAARGEAVRWASCAVAALLLAERALVLPELPALIILPFLSRVLIVFALVAPIGIALGVFMPVALDYLKRTTPALTPWAWGVNGIFSVIAPIVSVAVSMTWGINLLFVAASAIYLVAGLTCPLPARVVNRTVKAPASAR